MRSIPVTTINCVLSVAIVALLVASLVLTAPAIARAEATGTTQPICSLPSGDINLNYDVIRWFTMRCDGCDVQDVVGLKVDGAQVKRSWRYLPKERGRDFYPFRMSLNSLPDGVHKFEGTVVCADGRKSSISTTLNIRQDTPDGSNRVAMAPAEISSDAPEITQAQYEKLVSDYRRQLQTLGQPKVKAANTHLSNRSISSIDDNWVLPGAEGASKLSLSGGTGGAGSCEFKVGPFIIPFFNIAGEQTEEMSEPIPDDGSGIKLAPGALTAKGKADYIRNVLVPGAKIFLSHPIQQISPYTKPPPPGQSFFKATLPIVKALTWGYPLPSPPNHWNSFGFAPVWQNSEKKLITGLAMPYRFQEVPALDALIAAISNDNSIPVILVDWALHYKSGMPWPMLFYGAYSTRDRVILLNINDPKLFSLPFVSDFGLHLEYFNQTTFAHEIGHAMGLEHLTEIAHDSLESEANLMRAWPPNFSYTTLHQQCWLRQFCFNPALFGQEYGSDFNSNEILSAGVKMYHMQDSLEDRYGPNGQASQDLGPQCQPSGPLYHSPYQVNCGALNPAPGGPVDLGDGENETFRWGKLLLNSPLACYENLPEDMPGTYRKGQLRITCGDTLYTPNSPYFEGCDPSAVSAIDGQNYGDAWCQSPLNPENQGVSVTVKKCGYSEKDPQTNHQTTTFCKCGIKCGEGYVFYGGACQTCCPAEAVGCTLSPSGEPQCKCPEDKVWDTQAMKCVDSENGASLERASGKKR